MKKILILALLAAPLTMFAQKFGHVNVEEIIPLMPAYTKAQTELQNAQKEYEDELRYMNEEFQKKLQDYDAQAKTLPETTRQRREQELTELNERMNKYAQTAETELQQLSAERMAALENKILEAIKAVGDAGDFLYIFSNQGQIPYIGKGSVDVTQQVKDKLGIK